MNTQIRATIFVVAFAACTVFAAAQEIAFLDLTGVKPRVDLRYPPFPPPKCNKEGVCTGEGYSVMSIACGGLAPGELRADLLFLDRAEYVDGDNAEVDVEIWNVGQTAVQIPWTPHLADLQPDESARFEANELQVGLFLNWAQGVSTSLGWLDLYGDPAQPGTMMTLSPGEYLRIRGQIKIAATHGDGISLPPLELAQRASAKTLFKKVEFIPHPGGISERISNGSPKEVDGTDQPIQILAAFNNN